MTYVLITPARNERALIGNTLRSVVSQTQLPRKWVVVSDGSTDGTDEVVREYAARHPWIELVRMEERRDRQFAAKVHCFNAGWRRLEGLEYEVIGNLDADVSFEEDYLGFLMGKFRSMPRLGVAGTPYVGDGYDSARDSFEGEKHVPGGVQLFRRRCFEEIGGYLPIKGGGLDWIAVTSARMKGWETRSFQEKRFLHHRATGTAGTGPLRAAFHYGKKDYYLGGHPVWQVCRMAYRMTKPPILLGGFLLMAGYAWAFARRMPRPVPPELMEFHRKEQMEKLRSLLARRTAA